VKVVTVLIIFLYKKEKWSIWNPKNLIDSRYIWLPVSFAVGGTPYVQWIEDWKLSGMK
jgi:hypothetical protein